MTEATVIEETAEDIYHDENDENDSHNDARYLSRW